MTHQELPEGKRPERGKYVKRSVFQSVCEDNKKLLKDIYILVMWQEDNIGEWCDTWQKWNHKFTQDRAFAKMIKEYAIQYFKDHPEKRIDIPPTPEPPPLNL